MGLLTIILKYSEAICNRKKEDRKQKSLKGMADNSLKIL